MTGRTVGQPTFYGVHMAARTDEIRGDKFSVRRVGDEYVRIAWDNNAEVLMDDARHALDAIEQAAEGKRMPLLVDMASMRTIGREARALFSATQTVNRVALIVGTALSRTVGSFFIGLGKPQNPTKLFTDESAAVSWLLENER